MNLTRSIDTLHQRVQQIFLFQLFTSFTRCILAVGFILPSIPKILHKPFTNLSTLDPVGAYFKALYDTGYYYDFIGWSQLIAAILLLIPKTAHLGSLLFFPIILNITVLTNAVGFKGTWLVTILMLLANIYLLCWEYDRIKPFLFYHRTIASKIENKDLWLILIIFFLGSLGIIGLMLLLGITTFEQLSLKRILPILGGGMLFGLAVYIHSRFMKVGIAKDEGRSE